MTRRQIAIFLCFFFLATVGYGAYLLMRSRTFQLAGELISRVDTTARVVALTFDDAPGAYTQEVLSILAEKNVKATFYCIGASLEEHPVEAKAIVLGGHELGNHSYSHERMVFKSQSFIAEEITRTNALIEEVGYTDEITFRPPNGKKLVGLPWYLSEHDIRTIMWDVEPDTYVSGDTQQITQYVLDHVVPGSIVLMHPFCGDACTADREALSAVIDGLRAEGYTFVTVGELMKMTK